MNANREISPQDNKLRIVKRQESMKIDALVATSMAHHTIVELEIN
jgi:phage terminase large subunit-like protein